MKLFNTDIIDTVADDKRCLIQGWCFKKSLSTVPKRKIYVFQRCVTLRAHDVTLNQNSLSVTVTSEDSSTTELIDDFFW